jgi:DNA-binding NtrC family response regulator
MSDITSDPTLTRAEIRNHYTARALRNRVAVYRDNYEKAAETLGTTRSTLYRLLSQFDILTRSKRVELERAGEEVERNLRGGEEGPE